MTGGFRRARLIGFDSSFTGAGTCTARGGHGGAGRTGGGRVMKSEAAVGSLAKGDSHEASPRSARRRGDGSKRGARAGLG